MRHVIGFGNPLHGDDGAAAAVCALLQEHPLPDDVRVFDAGTRGLGALALFEACDEAILIDAALPAGSPGAIHRPHPGDVIPEHGLSGHVSGVGAILQALAMLERAGEMPPRLQLVTVEAAALTPFQPGLSAPVARAVSQVAADLRRHLEIR